MRSFLLSAGLILCINASAQQQYQYKIDLANIEADKVKVQLTTPKVTTDEIVFSFPKVIPGSYSEKNYGRFIESFKAFDAEGKPIKTKKSGSNQYLIKEAQKLSSITYLVNDSWDEQDKKEHIFEPGGSNIDATKNIVLNNFAFFGYIEGYNKLPLTVEITKPADMFGSTALQKQSSSATTDIIEAKTYWELADNPVLYCVPDTISFKAANTTVHVSVYSATGKIKSGQVANYLRPMAGALQQFFTTLPADNYSFLFFFDDGETPVRGKQDGGWGALEHHSCSFYYLPEMGFEPKLKSMVSDVTSHEFLHILTPLNVHSEQIENFDFTSPEMSAHLWMYEGVTEYFSNLVQLQSGIINEEAFAKDMRKKINDAEEHGDFSMTEMSRRVLEDKFQKKYGTVYNRGALLAFLLDIWIIDKTGGDKNLKSVMVSLWQKYGKSKPFRDDQLFDEIVAFSHPDVREFLDTYIAGDKPLPYQSLLPKVGMTFYAEKKADAYILGKMGMIYDDKEDAFKFQEVEKNALNIKDGDILTSINGVMLTQQNVEDMINEYLFKNSTHAEIAISIKRNGSPMELKGKLHDGYRTMKNYIELNKSKLDGITERNRLVWLGKK